MFRKRGRLRIAAPIVLATVMVAALTTIVTGTANAVPFQCDQHGGFKEYYCANVTGVPAGATIPLRQQAASDAPPVSGAAYQDEDPLVLYCWATSPAQEGPPGDSYWFNVFDPKEPALTGYISDANLTTGSSSDWLDRVTECSGNEPEPVQEGTFPCDYHGGNYDAACARVTGISALSYLHLLDQPDSAATHLTANSYNSGSDLALVCWTTGRPVDGDQYWFQVFDPVDNAITGYINDFYLATGAPADWQKAVPAKCATTGKPPAQVTRVNNGRDPNGSFQFCPQRNNKPDIQPFALRTRSVTVTRDNKIETRDNGVQALGTVQNCLAIQSLSPTRGVVFSRTHVRLGNSPKWDLTSRVLGLTTTVSAGRQFRQGSFTTVYPPYQVGCHPQACRSETYFLTRAYGPAVTGHTGFVQRLADYAFESRPNPAPVCNGQYRFTTVRALSDPGGDNFETIRTVSTETAAYQQAGWMPRPGTLDFDGVTFRWRSSKTFDATMWSAEARDRVALRTAGSRVEVRFKIDDGNSVTYRNVDVLTADGTAIEVKTGGGDISSVSRELQQQIDNDAAIQSAASSGVSQVVWHFFPNPANPSSIGPSAAVRNALDKAHIKWVRDDAGRLCT